MLSRVANSIYWMNRYIERAENYARFMGVKFNLILDMPPSEREQWEPLLVANADNHLFYEYFDSPGRDDLLNLEAGDRPMSSLAGIGNAQKYAPEQNLRAGPPGDGTAEPHGSVAPGDEPRYLVSTFRAGALTQAILTVARVGIQRDIRDDAELREAGLQGCHG